MKYYNSKLAICPYYKDESLQMIRFGGIVEGTATHVAFANAAQAKQYKCQVCRKNYHNCRIAKMLEIGGSF